MHSKLYEYLRFLKDHGIRNGIPNVSEPVGRFLNMMIHIQKPLHILEIGCANGYSTLWMADAARNVGAIIHTIDHSRPTFDQAVYNIAQMGMDDVVRFYFGDALRVIHDFPFSLKFDFVFVDGEKGAYADFWNGVLPLLSHDAVVVFDDMIAFPKKTKCFYDLIASDLSLDSLLLPIDEGDGILILRFNTR